MSKGKLLGVKPLQKFENKKRVYGGISLKTAYQKIYSRRAENEKERKMKQFKQKTMEWLEKRFGKALYNDLFCKETIEEAADYFLENTSTDEIAIQGGLNYALEAWTEEFTSAEELESRYTKEQIEMLQENACAANEGRAWVYTEEEIYEA